MTFLEASELLEILPSWHRCHTDVPGYDFPEHDLRTACTTHTNVWEVYVHTVLEMSLVPVATEFGLTTVDVLYRTYFIPVIQQDYQEPVHKQMLNNLQKLSSSPVCLEPVACVEEMPDIDSTPYELVLLGKSGTVVSRDQQLRDSIPGVSMENGGLLKLEIVQPGDKPRQPSKTLFSKIRSMAISLCTPLTALTFGILEALLIKFFLIHEQLVTEGSGYVSADYIHYYCNIPLIVFCIVVDGIPLLTVTCHCVCVIREFPHKRTHPPAYKNSILLALLGITVLSSFKIIVSSIKLHKQTGEYSERVLQFLTLLECTVFLPQYFLQSLLIYVGQHRLSDPSNVQYATLQGALSYIAMNNFVLWGISSFLGQSISPIV